MASITPTPITVAFNATTSFTPQAPVQSQFALDRTNPQYVRNATLTQDALYLQVYTASVVIPLTNLFAQCITILPQITWPPIIIAQPTSSTVVHPTGAHFVVSASSEVSISYQWFSSSFSQSGAFSPLTSSGPFTGTATNALTMSSTNLTMSNSLFYCRTSNVSGVTYTLTASLFLS